MFGIGKRKKAAQEKEKQQLLKEAEQRLDWSEAEQSAPLSEGTETEFGTVQPPNYVLCGENATHGPLQHARAMPLPLRVKTGHIADDKLYVETAQEIFEVPWNKVRFAALGMIEEQSEQEGEAYYMQKFVNGMAKMAKGKSSTGKIVSVHKSYYLDLYCDGFKEALRFDSSIVNYRGFLKEYIAFVSFQNFFRLVHMITSRCTSAKFAPIFKPFLLWQRDRLQVFTALHDFEDDSAGRLNNLDKQLSWEDLDFSRRSWAAEWVDE